jgi:carbonic anhydrase
MKRNGKSSHGNARIIFIIAVLILLFIVAMLAVYVFLRDSGETSAKSNDIGKTPLVGSQEDRNQSQAGAGRQGQYAQDGENEISNVQEENKNEAVTGQNTTSGNIASGNTTSGNTTSQEPPVTVIQREKVTAQNLTLGWNNILIPSSINLGKIGLNYTNLKYKVEYYYNGKIDNEKTEVIRNQKEGNTIKEYTDKCIDGYELDKVDTLPLSIQCDETKNVIQVHYKLRTDLSYKVYYKQEGTEKELSEPKQVKNQTFGTTVTENAINIPGYSKVNPKTIDIKITTGENEVTFYYKANNDTKYIVKHYQENLYNNEYTLKDVEHKKGTTDTNAFFKEKTYTGFTYEPLKTEPEERTIKGDGSLVIKLYYARNRYSVTYKPGAHGDFETKVFSNLKYGSLVPLFIPTPEAGYRFSYWSPMINPFVTQNAEYTAKWEARKDIKYVVEYYQEKLNSKEYVLVEKDTKKGETGKQATFTVKTYTGFTYEPFKTQPFDKTIKGDGSLVIKLYYSRNKYSVTYKPGTQGTFSNKVYTNLEYESPTPFFVPTGKPGYDFVNWSPAVTPKVLGNAEYTANWKPRTDTKYVVEHYQENLLNNGYTLKEKENKKGTTDALATFSPKTYEGFVYNSSKTEPANKTIRGDGTLVIKLYYDREEYTVTYKSGTQGNFTDKVYKNLKYGTPTPGFMPTGKVGYDFAGWEPVVSPFVNKDAVYTAKWKPKTDTKYVVEHYQENLLNNGYTLKEKENKKGTTDALATFSPKTYEGFTYDSSKTTPADVKIKGDGSLVIKLYYSRNKYTVTYKSGTQGNFTDKVYKDLKYGTATPNYTATGKPGYTFDKWEPNVSLTVTQNAVYTAKWKPRTDTKYVVEHYQENLNDNNYTFVEKENKTGITDALATVMPKTYEGFTYDPSKTTPADVKIKGDGTLVIKLYYTRNKYTVTYKPGTQGNFTDKVYSNLKYGTATPNYTAIAKPGYTFDKWEPNVSSTVTKNVEYVAKWKPNTNAQYVVEHYQENLNDNNYTFVEKEDKTGTTDTLATFMPKTYVGFTYDSSKTTPADVKIKGDGTLVIKLYYTRNKYTVTYKPGEEGNFADQVYPNLKYGAVTPSYTATGKPGYIFAGWSPAVNPTVTGNIIYTATWVQSKKYKVEHYKQNVNNNNYTLEETEEKHGGVGTQAVFEPKEYTGFTYEEIKTEPLNKTIPGGGMLTIKLYYARNKYTVTYKPGTQGNFTDVVYSDIKYGAATPNYTPVGKPGYTFAGWSPAFDSTVTNNIEYTATWTPSTNTKYVVEHYQENLNDNNYSFVEKENKTGTTDTLATFTPKTYQGFTYDSSKTIPADITIKGDGTLVIKLYYTRNRYTVTYRPGAEGNFTETVFSNLKYNSNTPNFDPKPKPGYKFDKWTPKIEAKVTRDVVYTATWKQV